MLVYLLSKVCFMFGGLENLILHPAAHSKLDTHRQTKYTHRSQTLQPDPVVPSLSSCILLQLPTGCIFLDRENLGGIWRSQSVLTKAKVNSPAALKLWWLHLLKHSQKSKENDLYQILYHLITANCIY